MEKSSFLFWGNNVKRSQWRSGQKGLCREKTRKEEFPKGVWQEALGSPRVAQVVREGRLRVWGPGTWKIPGPGHQNWFSSHQICGTKARELTQQPQLMLIHDLWPLTGRSIYLGSAAPGFQYLNPPESSLSPAQCPTPLNAPWYGSLPALLGQLCPHVPAH